MNKLTSGKPPAAAFWRESRTAASNARACFNTREQRLFAELSGCLLEIGLARRRGGWVDVEPAGDWL